MTLLDQIEGAHRRVLQVSGGCHNCPRRRVDFVPATLRQGPVLWLGEAPGKTEVAEQEGFVGKSGQLLRREADDAGVPEPWSFSNTIHCRPPENDTPQPKEISCCLSQFVLDEIRGYPVVVLAGAIPLKALFPKARQDHFVGNVAWHPDFPGQRFYSIYHPAYVLRRPDLLEDFRKHLKRLARIAKGEPPVPWKIIRGAKGIAELKQMVAAPMLSFDVETTKTATWEPGMRIKSFCATVDGKTVVAAHEDDPSFTAGLTTLQGFLEAEEKSVIGANVAFDVEVLETDLQFTAKCTGVHDPAIWWYEAGKYQQASLKQLVSDQLDGYRYLIHEPHLMRDVDLLLNYNAEDVVHPIALVQRAAQRVQPNTRDLVTRVLSPATLILRRMQATGLHIREDYRLAKIAEYKEQRRAAVLAWKDEDPEFIPSTHESGKGLMEYLFKIRQLPVISQTEKGAAVTDQGAVKQWIHNHGATYLKHLLTIREIDKYLSTYLEAYEGIMDARSRIHPRHWLTTTDSSRPSCREPNVYNIPRDRLIRDLFGCPPGSVLVESDLSQIEFRIMVCLAKDENGIAGYLRGDDAHTMTARTIAGVDKPTKEQRSLAKPVNFGTLYGGSEYMLQQYAFNEYGVVWTIDEARGFRNNFMATYPRIPEFHRASERKLVFNRGNFESVTGHVFYYDDWNNEDKGRRDHAVRSAINAEAQGPASNICFYIAVLARRLLDQRGFASARFVNSVYDSIMTEVPQPKWIPDIIATMNEATAMAYEWVRPWFIVPLVIEHATGESWGSLEEWKVA